MTEPLDKTVPIKHILTKVPAVTLIFWIIKIVATTLGETAGDAMSMSLVPSLINRYPLLQRIPLDPQTIGYIVGTAIFGAIFIVAVIVQIRAKKFHPFLYWTTIIATTTVGTNLADFADRSLGIKYIGGTILLLSCLLTSLFIWHRTLGSISVSSIITAKAEIFYWLTIMFSQTLGTALGDWTAADKTADPAGLGLGFAACAILFGVLLLLIVAAYYWTPISRTLLFWVAFILTRPLGAVVGDLLDKPHDEGGLALSRYTASAALLIFIVACILIVPQRASKHAH